MNILNPNRAGLAFGTLLGGLHAIWSITVALGWAQAIMDFVFWMHMIKPVYIVGPFSFGIALILVAVTGAIGFVGGFVFATIWNWLHQERQQATPHAGELTPLQH